MESFSPSDQAQEQCSRHHRLLFGGAPAGMISGYGSPFRLSFFCVVLLRVSYGQSFPELCDNMKNVVIGRDDNGKPIFNGVSHNIAVPDVPSPASIFSSRYSRYITSSIMMFTRIL
jgi:hypothetical protein